MFPHRLLRGNWRYTALALLLMAPALAVLAVNAASQNKQAPDSFPAEVQGNVLRVVDGDSLYLKGYRPQVRLWGVDAPERGERGYAKARDTLAGLAARRALRCERVDVDKYRRLVARCYTASGVDINRALIESGAAREYCWFSKGYYGHCARKQP